MTSKECGAFIADLRKEKNFTQKQLAEKLNVSDKAISRWETGKGYPDVTSLVSLSTFFGVSVNELLAGKHIDTENITKIADENIILAFRDSEKSRRKQKKQITVYTVILLLILLPASISVIGEILKMTSQITMENILIFAVGAVIAVLFLIVGIAIRKGHVSLIHAYHYKNVTDFDGYTREMGNAVIYMSIPISVNAFLNLFAHIKAMGIIGGVLLIAGLILCFVYIFKIQVKYNGGLF